MTSTPPDGDRLRVLVVDDSRDTADMLAVLLNLWSYDARAAYDGPAALDTVADFRPDAALIDLAMPGMDGCELAGRLGTEVVRIALTGYGDEAHRRLTAAAGFIAHLLKPVDPGELRDLLAVLAREKAKGNGRP